MSSDRKPTFLILGAAKCGTTSLYQYLRQHPQVCMSEPKEPFFFEAEYERGLHYYWNRNFAGWRGEPAIGEARHRNLYLPYVGLRIWESLPEAKLIVLLRNPIDRAHSHWWHWHGRGLLEISFEEAIEKDIRDIEKGVIFEGEEGARAYRSGLVEPYGYHQSRSTIVDSGYYAEQVGRYLRLFPTSEIKIIFFEDLCVNPALVTQEVCRFIGVKEDLVEDVSAVHSQSVTGRGPVLRRLGRLPGTRLVLRRVRKKLKQLLGERRPILHPNTRRMLGEHYSIHNRRLEELTGRDLSHWDQ